MSCSPLTRPARPRPRRRSSRGRQAPRLGRAPHRSGRAAAGPRPAGACAGRSAAPSGQPHPPRPECVGEQLQVREHAGQRRAQLVRGVGDELALAGEHRLGLAARRVELAQHPLERPRELCDLVVGLRLGHRRARGRGCARSPPPTSSGSRSATSRGGRSSSRPTRQQAAGDHAEEQEQLDALDRFLGAPTRGARTGRSRGRPARPSSSAARPPSG